MTSRVGGGEQGAALFGIPTTSHSCAILSQGDEDGGAGCGWKLTEGACPGVKSTLQ